MRVLHFIEGRASLTTANGVDRVVFCLSQAQAAAGAEISVFCESDKEVNPIPGVNVRNVSKVKSCFRLSQEAKDFLVEVAPDIIHLHSTYIPTGISIARWARKEGIPYVISPHGNYSRQLALRNSFLKWVYRRVFELPCAARSAWVHSMGDGDAIREFGYQGEMKDFPNGFSLSDVLPETDANIIESRLEDREKRFVFLYLGRLDYEQKGLDLMLEGFAKFHQKEPSSLLVLVGPSWRDGEDRAKALAEKLELDSSTVIFWGKAFGQEKADLLHAADAFIHTSRWEGFPMAMIEAMAYEKVCLTTPAADPWQSIGGGDLGFVCSPRVDEIEAGMSVLFFSDEKTRLRMGQAAKQTVEEQFSWESIAGEMLDGYREVCVGRTVSDSEPGVCS